MLEQRIAQWEEELMNKGMLVGEEKGKSEGFLLGEEKGKAEGIVLGEEKALINQKNTLLEMLNIRFAEFPQEWKVSINLLPDGDSVSRLMIALLAVKTPEEFRKLLIKE